jgi:hypothetical protein
MSTKYEAPHPYLLFLILIYFIFDKHSNNVTEFSLFIVIIIIIIIIPCIFSFVFIQQTVVYNFNPVGASGPEAKHLFPIR